MFIHGATTPPLFSEVREPGHDVVSDYEDMESDDACIKACRVVDDDVKATNSPRISVFLCVDTCMLVTRGEASKDSVNPRKINVSCKTLYTLSNDV
jgi:hypothetical protein